MDEPWLKGFRVDHTNLTPRSRREEPGPLHLARLTPQAGNAERARATKSSRRSGTFSITGIHTATAGVGFTGWLIETEQRPTLGRMLAADWCAVAWTTSIAWTTCAWLTNPR